MSVKEILFLSPYQGLPVVAFGHTGFVETLRELNFRVTTLLCGGMLVDSCIVSISMQKDSLPKAEKEKFCTWCKSYSKQFENITSGDSIYLDKFLDDDARKNIASIVTQIIPSKVRNFQIDGIPVGRISAYNFILNNKILDIEACTEEQFEIYRNHLSACLHAYFAFKSFIAKHHSRYSHIVVHNTMYAIHNVIRHVSNESGIKTIHLDVGYHYNYAYESWRFSLLPDNKVLRTYNLNFFEKNRDSLSFSDESYVRLINFVDTHWNKKNNRVYSSAASRDLKSLKTNLGITSNFRKVVLIATSSDDETYAYEFAKNINSTKSYRLFKSQDKWLESCIEFFRNKPDIFVIIRVHPREFFKFQSASSLKIIEKFGDLPPNIFLNTPDQNISLYDLLNVLDLVLVNISTTGVEAGLVGLPTISSNDRIYYPIDYKGQDFEDLNSYFETIEEILSEKETRKLRYLLTSIEWIMYTGVNTNLNFNNNKYFEKYPKKDIFSSFIKKIKKRLHLPAMNLRTYLKNFSMTSLEKEMMYEFLENETEIVDYHHSRVGSQVWDKKSDLNIKKLLKDLLSIFIDLELVAGKDFDQLMSIRNHENKTVNFFVDEFSKLESRNNGT